MTGPAGNEPGRGLRLEVPITFSPVPLDAIDASLRSSPSRPQAPDHALGHCGSPPCALGRRPRAFGRDRLDPASAADQRGDGRSRRGRAALRGQFGARAASRRCSSSASTGAVRPSSLWHASSPRPRRRRCLTQMARWPRAWSTAPSRCIQARASRSASARSTSPVTADSSSTSSRAGTRRRARNPRDLGRSSLEPSGWWAHRPRKSDRSPLAARRPPARS